MGAWQSPQQQELEKKPVVTGDPSSKSQVRFQLREKGHLENWSQNGKPGISLNNQNWSVVNEPFGVLLWFASSFDMYYFM